MSRFIKLLPALALAVALSPLAAYAQTAPQQTQLNGQTVVQSGPANQMYPDSFGSLTFYYYFKRHNDLRLVLSAIQKVSLKCRSL